MAVDVIMPSLGFDMTEGTLARWLVQEGERIEKGQPLAEIETEKATVEIEATVSGVVARIVVPAGKTVPVGTVIGTIASPEEKIPEKERTESPPPAPPPPGAKASAPSEPAEAPPAPPAEGRVKASPVARRMAEDAGIDLARIRGTGPGGRVMERDVKGAIESKPVPERTPPPPAVPAAGERLQQSRMRQAIARRMTESKTTAPHFYVTVKIDMDEAMRMRDQMNRLAPAGEKISVNDFVVAAAARTLPRFPALNSSFRDGNVEPHSNVNIGIAVALDDGLITPVLRDADGKSLKAIAAEARALSDRARAGKLRSDDLGFGTFTVSNLGMFEVDEFIAIINPPESAILAVGAVTRSPVAAGSDVRIAQVMKATLSVDHRVADGAQAGRFLQEFRKLLENPVNLLTA